MSVSPCDVRGLAIITPTAIDKSERSHMDEAPTITTQVPHGTISTQHALAPITASSYQIPPTTMSRIRENATRKRICWSHKLYRNPTGDPIRIHYCTTTRHSEAVAQRLLSSPLLGFDMEWKPQRKCAYIPESFKEAVSLIQLANESEIALFHIAMHAGTSVNEVVAPSLREILVSGRIVKTGVNIVGADGRRLKRALGIEARGLFELSHLHNIVKDYPDAPTHVSKKLVALAYQVQTHLLLPMHKGKVRVSDWSKALLSAEQVNYAASDAYAGYMLYRTMDDKRRMLTPVPALPLCTDMTSSSLSKNPESTADIGRPAELSDQQEKGLVTPNTLAKFRLSDTPSSGTERLSSQVRPNLSYVLDSHNGQPSAHNGHASKSSSNGQKSATTVNNIDLSTNTQPTRKPLAKINPNDRHPPQSTPSNNHEKIDRNVREHVPAAPDTDTRQVWQPTPSSQHSLMQKRIYNALLSLRTRMTTVLELNGPSVVKDATLWEISEAMPKSMRQLELIPGASEFTEMTSRCHVDIIRFIEKHSGGKGVQISVVATVQAGGGGANNEDVAGHFDYVEGRDAGTCGGYGKPDDTINDSTRGHNNGKSGGGKDADEQSIANKSWILDKNGNAIEVIDLT